MTKVFISISNAEWACEGVQLEDHPHPAEFEFEEDWDGYPFLHDAEAEAAVWDLLQKRGVCLIDGEISITRCDEWSSDEWRDID